MPVEINEMTEANTKGTGVTDATGQLGKSDETDEATTSFDRSEAEGADDADVVAATESGDADDNRGRPWKRLLAFGLLPVLALVIAMAAGFLSWQDASLRAAETARVESMQAAKESTTALLSYRPDGVEKDLDKARDRLTGSFRNSYTSLIHDVVIPGAKQKQVSAVVSVPAVASVTASANHAVALVFVNQTITIGADAPTTTTSTVKVTLDMIGGHWLISDFTPV
jgi:Mce-associated membrane protein